MRAVRSGIHYSSQRAYWDASAGNTVAVTAGSREISHIDIILKTLIDA